MSLNPFSPLGIFGQNSQAEGSNAEISELLWGHWKRSADWQDDLHKKASHKALNISEEPVINSATYKSGLGWKELLTLGLLGLGGAGLWSYANQPGQVTPVSPVVIQQPSQDPPMVNIPPSADTNTRYRFDVGNPSDFD